MKRVSLIFLSVLFTTFVFSQNEEKVEILENHKKKFELQIGRLIDSIKKVDLEIAKIKSKKFMDKIRDSSLTAIARKGAKLKKAGKVYADVIEVFDEDKEVIILDYKEDYFEVCKGSLCGYMSEIWIIRNNSTSEFIKSKEIENKFTRGLTKISSSYSSSQNNYIPNTSAVKKHRSSRSYYRGPRGGCYYINSKGNKTYVARSLCN